MDLLHHLMVGSDVEPQDQLPGQVSVPPKCQTKSWREIVKI